MSSIFVMLLISAMVSGTAVCIAIQLTRARMINRFGSFVDEAFEQGKLLGHVDRVLAEVPR